MDAGTITARQTRTEHRHELRSLTYVTLDQANGGIVRNLTHSGIGVQAVAAIRPQQEVRVRFELRYPRLPIETRGEVMWSTLSGLCGIRFLDLPPRLNRQIQEWIFGDLLEGISLHSERAMFAQPALHLPARNSEPVRERSFAEEEEDGLLVSAAQLKVIELQNFADSAAGAFTRTRDAAADSASLEWLLRPLSTSGLTWTVNTLALLAGLLLFALVFLSVTHETPTWPVLLASAFFVPAMYWGFFQMFGGCSLGARLARLATGELEEEEEPMAARFR